MRRGLSQAEMIDAAQDLSDTDASTFAASWRQFTQIWPSFLALQPEIQEHADRWAALAEAAYRDGDLEGYRALTAKAEGLRRIEADRLSVEQTVAKFKDGWDALWSYISNAGRWFGLQGLGIFPPLVLAIGIPALLAAIAWVVQKYFEIRAGLDYDLSLLTASEQGKITPQQAQALKRPTEAGVGAGFTWPAALGLVGVGLLALFAFGGRR